MKTIMYAIDQDTGFVVSRIGGEIAIPILDYESMKPENDFKNTWYLEKMNVLAVSSGWSRYKWTRKIPFAVKNQHRKFWGLKPLTRRPNDHEATALWQGLTFKHAGKTFEVVRVKHDTDPDFDSVVLRDEKKDLATWNFSGMIIYIKEHPDCVVKKSKWKMM